MFHLMVKSVKGFEGVSRQGTGGGAVDRGQGGQSTGDRGASRQGGGGS